MIHNYISNNQHWAVSHNSYGDILIQLGDSADQVRLALSPVQAQQLLNQLQSMIKVAQKDRELEFRILYPINNLTSFMKFDEYVENQNIFLSDISVPTWTTNPEKALHFISINDVLSAIEHLKTLGLKDLYFDNINPND